LSEHGNRNRANGPARAGPSLLKRMPMKLLLTIADVSPETWGRDIMSQPMVLGRDKSADIRFKHRSVSRQHCRFWVEDGECLVKACQNMNGTYVNATRIDKCKLQSVDRLLVGKFDLLVAKEQ